jgi:hypothetical protein
VYTIPLPDDPEDPLSQGIQYSIVGGNGSALFTITPPGSRNVSVAPLATFDFESMSLSRFQVVIRATDSGGLFGSFLLDVVVLDDNDLPVVTSPAAFSTPENVAQSVALYNFTFVDVDASDSHVCSLSACSRPRCLTLYRINISTCRLFANGIINFEDRESNSGLALYCAVGMIDACIVVFADSAFHLQSYACCDG